MLSEDIHVQSVPVSVVAIQFTALSIAQHNQLVYVRFIIHRMNELQIQGGPKIF